MKACLRCLAGACGSLKLNEVTGPEGESCSFFATWCFPALAVCAPAFLRGSRPR